MRTGRGRRHLFVATFGPDLEVLRHSRRHSPNGLNRRLARGLIDLPSRVK
jgi:hypothetical protein